MCMLVVLSMLFFIYFMPGSGTRLELQIHLLQIKRILPVSSFGYPSLATADVVTIPVNSSEPYISSSSLCHLFMGDESLR